MNLQELIEKRRKLVEEMRSIIDAAPEGVLSAEAEEKYNKIDDQQEVIGAQVERENRMREIESNLEKPTTRKVPQSAGAGTTPEKSSEKLAELQLRCFREYIRNGANAFHSSDFAELRSLNAGLVTEGGAFIPPTQFVNELIKAVDDQVHMRRISRTFQVNNAGSLGFPVLDADPADADWTTELATGSLDSSMATGLRELKPLPIAKRVKISRKLIRNSTIPVEQLVRERLAYKFAITQEKAFLTGNGATAPLGIFTASSAGIPTSRDVSTDNTTTAVTVDGLIEALWSLKEPYQRVAEWIMHRTTGKMIRKLKDGQGQYIWQPSMEAGRPGTILDRPYSLSEYAPNTYTTGLYVAVVGDFSKYYIADDIGTLEIQKLTELYAETNQDGFIGRMESDGMPVLAEAFARVKLA